MTPLETAGEEPANPVGGVGSPRRSDQGGRATRPASEGPGRGRRVRVSPSGRLGRMNDPLWGGGALEERVTSPWGISFPPQGPKSRPGEGRSFPRTQEFRTDLERGRVRAV